MEQKDKDIFEQTTKFNTGIKLYMFQTGTIKTKIKFIKMNQGEEPFEIPVPWFLIKHPKGDIIIDGGMPIETAIDTGALPSELQPNVEPLILTHLLKARGMS